MKRLSLSLLLLLLAPSALAESVSLTGARWKAMQAPDDAELPAPPAPVASERVVAVQPVDEALRVTVRWTVRSWEPGWYDAPLCDGAYHVVSATWDGKRASTKVEEGVVRVTGFVDGVSTVELVVEVPGIASERPVALRLMPAVRGRIEVESAELQPKLTGEGIVRTPTGFATGVEKLTVQLVPKTKTAAKGTLAVAHAGIGLTVGDAEVRGRARLTWELRQGSLDSVRFSAGGTGRDLDVTGPNVREWSRSGDTVTVQLQKTVHDRLELDLRWSTAVPVGAEANLAVPGIRPLDAFRTDASLQLARDGDVEVVPSLDGWQSVSARTIPSWGEGLVEGTATAAFTRTGGTGGQLSLLRLDLVDQPAVMVDVAQFEVATTHHGRTLTRALYEVRNERASHLRVRPPAGAKILGVRVSGETALPTTDGSGGWLIPLQRSVETVEGLLSFPVEVILLGDLGDWDRSEERSMALPMVSAPVAVSRTTVYLPPGYRSRLEPGDQGSVDSFSRGSGITYGFGIGDVGAAEADDKFKQAVSAYMDNDFEVAQGYLDELSNMGASSDNLRKLQSNLDVIEGKGDSEKDAAEVITRRVKEQARARAQEEERKADDYRREAEEMASSGRYAEASAYYNAALDIGRDIAKLEQNEAVELDARNNELEAALGKLEVAIENQVALEASAYDVDADKVAEETEKLKQRVFNSKATLALQQELIMDDEEEVYIVSDTVGSTSSSSYGAAAGKRAKKKDKGSAFSGGAYTVTFGSADEPAPDTGAVMANNGDGDPSGSDFYDFEGIEISGELVAPQGASLHGAAAFDGPGDVTSVDGNAYGVGAGGGGWAEGGDQWGDLDGADTSAVADLDDFIPLEAPAEPIPVSEPEADRYDYDQPDEVMAPQAAPDSRGVRLRVPSVNISLGGMRKQAPDAPPPPPATTAPLPEPKAKATSLSVVVPETGEAVLYQQLLIPADEAPEVALDARRIPENKLRRQLARQ